MALSSILYPRTLIEQLVITNVTLIIVIKNILIVKTLFQAPITISIF